MPARLFFCFVRPAACLFAVLSVCGLWPYRPARAAEASDHSAAVQAIQEGRYEDALSLLPSQALDARSSYLAARCLAELARYEEALARLPEPPADWPAGVRADLRTLRMRWAAEAGRCAEVEVWAAADGAGRDANITRFLARCAFTAGDHARVRALLSAAKDADGRAMYIRALFALNLGAEALPLARAFYVGEPAHADANALREQVLAHDPKFALSPAEQLDRSEALIRARRTEQALEELNALAKQSDRATEARRQHLRGEALFRMRTRYPEAAKAFADAAALAGATEAYDAFHAIRATSRAGQDKTAIKRYRAYAKKYPKSAHTADAVYLAAWLAARGGQKGAREELARFANSELAKQNKGLLRTAEWDLGWVAFKQRDYTGAATWLGRYLQDANSELERARASYWLGRSARASGKKARAIEHFKATTELDRLGYYAQLAVRQLRALGEPEPSPFHASASLPSAQKPALGAEARFYASLGLSEDASRHAEQQLSGSSDKAARALLLAETGDVAKTFVAASPYLNGALKAGPEAAQWLWEALFPRPYAALVEEHAGKHGIPSALFYGHMQIESRYRPEVVSSADAIGLMQLLPSTGARVAKRLGLPGTRAALKRPHVNIALGAAFLGQLLTRYKGQEPLAIAAYNAGESRVEEWIARTGRVELERWVEEIPIDQTRNYVRRVIGAWARYRAAQDPSEAWQVPIPTHVQRAP